jgi:hypothetical protein
MVAGQLSLAIVPANPQVVILIDFGCLADIPMRRRSYWLP